jgi:hypothetical protein
MCLPHSCVGTKAARIHREQRMKHLLLRDVIALVTRFSAACVRTIIYQRMFFVSTVLVLSKYATIICNDHSSAVKFMYIICHKSVNLDSISSLGPESDDADSGLYVVAGQFEHGNAPSAFLKDKYLFNSEWFLSFLEIHWSLKLATL